MNSKHRRLFQQNNFNTAEFSEVVTLSRRVSMRFIYTIFIRSIDGLSANCCKNLVFINTTAKIRLQWTLALTFGLICSAAWSNDTLHERAQRAVQQSLNSHFEAMASENWSFKANLPPTIFQCDQPFQIHWRDNPQPGANTAKLVCPDTPLQAYFSVKISAYKNIIVTTKPLTRGETLSVSDTTTKRMDVSNLRLGFFQERQKIAGWRLMRTVKAGQVLTPYIVKPPLTIKRGDWVRIETGSESLRVSMMGEALKDGHIGEQIPVKNLRSSKRIKAWVVSKGLVSTRKGAYQ